MISNEVRFHSRTYWIDGRPVIGNLLVACRLDRVSYNQYELKIFKLLFLNLIKALLSMTRISVGFSSKI